jgi:hypothetical protein
MTKTTRAITKFFRPEVLRHQEMITTTAMSTTETLSNEELASIRKTFKIIIDIYDGESEQRKMDNGDKDGDDSKENRGKGRDDGKETEADK